MPSRPSAARRRLHTDRIIAKRLRLVRLVGWVDAAELVRGRLDDEQWYLGCHRARWGVCHPEKRWSHGDRQREERQWGRYENLP
jgi:hypothetical protein